MKTALITGASSEIGMAMCHVLAAQDFRIICQYATDRKGDLFREKKKDFIPVRADFNDQESVGEFIDFINSSADSIDVIVHCAAKHEKMIADAADAALFDAVAHVNLFAPIFITRALADKMKRSDNPAIIFISSTYAKQRGSLENIYYASTKTALHTVSRIFAREFSPIRSNVIMPGHVDTPSYRFGRSRSDRERDEAASLGHALVLPQDIADTALFIIENKSVNGSVIAVDGGLHI